jgi:hypothetical protein
MRALAASFLLLSGCVSPNDPRLKAAEHVESLQAQLKVLHARVVALETQRKIDESQRQLDHPSEAIVDPAQSRGYSKVDSSPGSFLVTCQRFTQFADGVRATCTFGNPSSAAFRGFKLKARWGSRYDSSKHASIAAWEQSLRETEMSLPDTLRPGSWNPVSFVLAPARVDELGYLSLSVETSTVEMRR